MVVDKAIQSKLLDMHEQNPSAVVIRPQKPPAQKRLRRWARVIAVAAMMGGIYLALTNRSTNNNLGAPAGSKYLPVNTLAVVTLSTDRQRWQQLQLLGTPQSRAVVSKELSKWQQEFFTNNGLDFDRDIQPWIGSEIDVAYFAPLGKAVAGNQTKNLPIVLLPIKADLTATQLLDKITTKRSTPNKTVERNYQGILLRETTHNNKTLIAAVVERFVLLSPTAKAIEQSIDAFKSGQTLGKLPGYHPAWGAIPMTEPLAKVYINIPLALAGNTITLAPDKLAKLKQQQGLAANINLDGSVIRSKGIAWWQPNSKTSLIPSKNSPDFGQRLPENTLIMFSGSNLAQLWADYLPLASQNAAAPIAPETIINNLQAATGLNLATDVLAWSENEFSLSLVTEAKPSANSLGGSLLLMLKPTDRPAAQTTLDKLDQFMANRYQFKITKTNTNNTDVVNWSSPIGGVNATHGWLSNDLAFLALGTPITDQFLSRPAATLANNKQFQQVMKSEISPYDGQFFIDLEKTQRLHNSLIPQFTPTAQAVLEGISSIGMTSNASSDVTNRFDLSVSLQQIPDKIPSRSFK
jgi:Protein of unknown function (DUF3352)